MVEQPHDVSRTVQAREAQQANRLLQEVYALELDGHLLSLPTHKRGWRDFFRKTSTPIKAAAAGAMLMGGAIGANADQPNPLPEQAPGIEQTVNGGSGYVRLEYAPRNLGFPKKDFDWYRSTFDTFLRKTYKGIERDEIGYPLILDRFAESCVETKGQIGKTFYNKRVDFYNNYVTLASHIDSLKIKDEFKTTLKYYYATKIIQKGSTVDDTDAEKEKLSSIPSDSTIVTAKPGERLGDIVSRQYIGFNALSQYQQKNS